jgi:hypothetical protein
MATRARARRANGAAGFAKLDSVFKKASMGQPKLGYQYVEAYCIRGESAPITILVDVRGNQAVSHAAPFCWTGSAKGLWDTCAG